MSFRSNVGRHLALDILAPSVRIVKKMIFGVDQGKDRLYFNGPMILSSKK
jgi:hypothetical protein